MLELSRRPPAIDVVSAVHSAQAIATKRIVRDGLSTPKHQSKGKEKQQRKREINEVPKYEKTNEESSEAVRIKVSFGPSLFFSLRDLPKQLTAGSVWREKKEKEKQNITGRPKINVPPNPRTEITFKAKPGFEQIIEKDHKMGVCFRYPASEGEGWSRSKIPDYGKRCVPSFKYQRAKFQVETHSVSYDRTKHVLQEGTKKHGLRNEGQKLLFGPFLSGQGKLQTIRANPVKRVKIVANHMFQVLKQMMPKSNFEIRIKGNIVRVNLDTETIHMGENQLEENMRDLAMTDEVLKREGFYKAPVEWNAVVDEGGGSWIIFAFCLLRDARSQSMKLLEQSEVGHYRKRSITPTIEDVCTRSAWGTVQAKD